MSAIRKAVSDYLALRRALGFKLRMEGGWLEQFASFLEQRRATHVTTQLALAWATEPEKAHPSHLAHRLSVVRGFAEYRAATDPRTEVPPVGLLSYRYCRKPPHIYTDDEIRRLLVAASALRSKIGLRRQTYVTLLGLLVVTGMRMGEVVGLDRDDVDLIGGVLVIRCSKFGKSRLVPLHSSTQRALRYYAHCRDRSLRKPRSMGFFVGEEGQRLTVNVVEQTFVKLSHKIGLRTPADSHGPRLHDIRHRFAVNTLLRRYRAGVDVESHLPRLSTYLGHAHPSDTYWYLSAVPELMRLVVTRLDASPRGGAA
jgi:integrase/recombinase XerD